MLLLSRTALFFAGKLVTGHRGRKEASAGPPATGRRLCRLDRNSLLP